MGEEFCKECKNKENGEEEKNLSEFPSNKNFNKNEDNDTPDISELCKNLKKKPSKPNLVKKPTNTNSQNENILKNSPYNSPNNNQNNNPTNNNNYDNLKSTIKTSFITNDEIASMPQKVIVDEKEINKILNNYRANLIISAFRKFKKIKEESHQKVQYKSNIRERKSIISIEDLDVDLFPEENYNYLGHIFNEKKDGFGIQLFPKSSSKYIGYFENDKRINYCKFEDKLRLYTFKGDTNKNFAGKFGIYNNYGKGINYEGEWDNNTKNGIGIEKFKDGAIYKGEFKNGYKHGIGTYYWSDGSQYEGEFKSNLLEGYGIYKFKDGSFCSGFWISNQISGFGKFTYPGVKYYLGNFKKDYKCGFGLIFWCKERKTFIGFWKNNKQNGLGKFISNENIRYGFWEEGKKKIRYEENEFFNLLNEQNAPRIYVDIFGMDYDGLNEYIQNFKDL